MGKKRSPKGVSNRRGRAARAWRLGAVILAAGESRRMGSPKPLLRLGERTFLECVIEGAQAANPERIVVVTSEGLLNDLAALGLRGVTITINPHPERGMAESLRCGLRLLDALPDAVLVALADHPHVRPDSVAALARAAKRHHGKIILPVHDGRRGHPVIVPSELLPEILNLAPDRGLNWVIERHAGLIHDVALDDPGILMDIDTPEEFQRHGNFHHRDPARHSRNQ